MGGAVVQPMVSTGGVETILGITRDELFAVGAAFTVVAWGFAYLFQGVQVLAPGLAPLAPGPAKIGVPLPWSLKRSPLGNTTSNPQTWAALSA